MTLNNALTPFDDDFSRDFFQRRGIQFPSIFDSSSSTFFEDAKLDLQRIVAAFRRDVDELHKRLGVEFPSSKLFDSDPFSTSSLPRLLGSDNYNDNTFNSSRAIESFVKNNNNNNSSSSSFTNNNTTIVPAGENTPGKYTVNIPLGNRIQPEDLKISLKEENGLKIVTIEAKREEKSEDANRKSMFSQQVSQKFTLPPNVDIKTVQSTLTEGGNLKIEAPLQALPPPPAPAAIENRVQNHSVVKRYGPTNIPITLEK